jgi:putative phage-type endonuclease
MSQLFPSTYVQSRSIGGSDVAAVMGQSRYRTAAEVWDGIMSAGGPRPVEDDRGPTERGRALEGLALQLYQRKLECRVWACERRHAESHPFLHSTADSLSDARRDQGGPGVVEVKCPGSFVLRRWKEEGIPREYYLQIQHYLFVLGLGWAHFVALDYDSWDVWVVNVERDEQTIAHLVEACTTFWLDYVEQGIRPPDPVTPPQEPEWPKGRPGAKVVRNDPAWTVAVTAAKAAQENKALAEKAYKRATDAVKALMGEQEEVVGAGVRVVWSETTTKSLDRDALLAAHPEIDLDRFTKRTASRRMTLYNQEKT